MPLALIKSGVKEVLTYLSLIFLVFMERKIMTRFRALENCMSFLNPRFYSFLLIPSTSNVLISFLHLSTKCN